MTCSFPLLPPFAWFFHPHDGFLKGGLGFFQKYSFMPWQTTSSLIAYWHTLDSTCPKYTHEYGFSNWNTPQEITSDREKFKVAKFLPSFFTQAITLLINLNFAKRGLTISNKATPLVFGASNKTIVTWQGTHSQFKKFTIRAKVWKPICGIHKLNVTMVVSHCAKVGRT